jgi:acetoin utilization deacetylase AcuC-like enzyme
MPEHAEVGTSRLAGRLILAWRSRRRVLEHGRRFDRPVWSESAARVRIITDHRCTAYHRQGHPERPQRISRTVETLRAQTTLPMTWCEPLAVQEPQLRRAHSDRHLARLDQSFDFDADTPAYPDIREHALRSVGGALHALEAALRGETAFSLLRPPGHHATVDRAMGFCYLNSMAVAVLEALSRNGAKVAVLDFDVHHGNGTEAILLREKRCAYFSVHQYPAYPGTGTVSYVNAHNYPVLPGAPRKEYREALQRALDDLKKFAPGLIGVSAGFDAYAKDPLSDAALEEEDFHWLGAAIRGLGVPAFSILEGGYSHDLPELILAYLRGLSGK